MCPDATRDTELVTDGLHCLHMEFGYSKPCMSKS